MQKRIFSTTVIALAISGCSPYSPSASQVSNLKTPGANGEVVPSPTPQTNPQPTATPKPGTTPRPGTTPAPTPKPSTPAPSPTATPSPTLAICGPLSFKGISWSSTLTAKARTALALGLSVTGSFEGTQSWATIANNSDGQGMSLGIMQQNFGQGTLQPLLIDVILARPAEMASYFTASDFTSLKKMLSAWDSSAALSVQSTDTLFPEYLTNALEEDSADIEIQGAAEQASVAWARANLYSGSSFISRWKTSFQGVAATDIYRSRQVVAAMSMFNKAKAYFVEFGFTEMRSLLLMYDFVVQNGGFTSTHRANYRAWIAKNPNASETAKATQLLEIRLVSVLSQYRADVRSRKATIINSTGTVHGSSRNLPKEFCYTAGEKLGTF